MTPKMGVYTKADADADIAAHAAILDAHTRNRWQLFSINTDGYYTFYDGLTATYAIEADTLFATPFVIARDLTVDRIAIEVTGLVDPSNARLGIYRNSSEALLYPGSLLLDAGAIDSATTGIKAITIDQALVKGTYWAALISNDTPTIRIMRPSFCMLGTRSTSFTVYYAGLKKSRAYGALPTPFPSGAGTSSTFASGVWFRIASLD